MGPSGAGKVSTRSVSVVPCCLLQLLILGLVSSPCVSFLSRYVQTVLLSALTLDAFFGKPSGKVTLNGVPITDKIFKEHCYVVVQHDKHWPYLTCRETLRCAAELYDVVVKEDLDAVVDEIIEKMGLNVCGDTRNARLSGGQARRLSLGIALLKQPTMLFLDEPTSGLDSAAAENIMQEIVRVSKEEGLIILCSIHQPSTKVYNGFDQVVRTYCWTCPI
jgi:ABC-type multidrug transport system ATPase subunit